MSATSSSPLSRARPRLRHTVGIEPSICGRRPQGTVSNPRELGNAKNAERPATGSGGRKAGPARVSAIGTGSCTLFRGGNPPRSEGRQFENVDREDIDGVRYLRELLAGGAAGGGHVGYKFDNPTLRGDEETGSPKIAHAIGFRI